MHLQRVILALLIIHTVNAIIEWEIEYDKGGHPTGLKCRGPQEDGSWYKHVNRTDMILGTFKKNTEVQVKDRNFTIMAYLKGSNIETKLGLPKHTFGTFGCRFGSEHHLFFLPKEITANSESKPNSLTLQCKDTHHPYNISWYINSTLVAVVNVFNSSVYVVHDKNTSFTELKNISFHNNQATTKNDRPVCLTCIVSANDGFGDQTVCSPNTRDLSGNRQTRSENFLRTSRLEGENPMNAGNVMNQNAGLGFVAGVVAFVCAVAGIVLLIHVTGKKRRPHFGYDEQIYRPFSTSSGGTTERTTP